MNFQTTSSTAKTVKLLGMSVIGLSAALLAGMPSSAQSSSGGGRSDSSPGVYGGSQSSPSDQVVPQSPSDTTGRPTTDPAYGEPSGRMGNPSSRPGMRTPGVGQTPSEMPSEMPSDDIKKGPSAVGEGFPGPSESPSGSPSVPGTSTVDNPTRSR